MGSSLNKNLTNNDTIINVISSDKFGNLTPEMQQNILNQIEKTGQRDGGIMGKLFGTKKELAAMNIALIMCMILFIVGFAVNESQIWTGILTIEGTALGYIFGKGGGKNE